MRGIMLIALGVAAWLVYKLYLRQLLAQGTPGRIKLALITLGFVFLALALSGRAPALFAVLGAAMTQVMRFAPLLVRYAPSLRKYFGAGASPFASGGAGGSMGGGRGRGTGHSEVRSATIAMRLAHDSGTMDGEVLAGEFAGRTLSDLSAGEVVRLHAYCRREDTDAQRLLEAYVARERAAEFANAEELGGAAGAGSGDSSGAGGHDGGRNGGSEEGNGRGTLSVDESAAVLGVPVDADRDTIIAAHRVLMSRLHPDKGGSDYLAAKVNAAREVMLANRQA